MDDIEAHVKMPRGARPIEEYKRYYRWADESGEKKVVALFLLREGGGRQWVTRDQMPGVLDGGCGNIDVQYDVEAKRVEYALCNGDA